MKRQKADLGPSDFLWVAKTIMKNKDSGTKQVEASDF